MMSPLLAWLLHLPGPVRLLSVATNWEYQRTFECVNEKITMPDGSLGDSWHRCQGIEEQGLQKREAHDRRRDDEIDDEEISLLGKVGWSSPIGRRGQCLCRVSLLAPARGLLVHGIDVGVGLFVGGIDHAMRTGRCQYLGLHFQDRRWLAPALLGLLPVSSGVLQNKGRG